MQAAAAAIPGQTIQLSLKAAAVASSRAVSRYCSQPRDILQQATMYAVTATDCPGTSCTGSCCREPRCSQPGSATAAHSCCREPVCSQPGNATAAGSYKQLLQAPIGSCCRLLQAAVALSRCTASLAVPLLQLCYLEPLCSQLGSATAAAVSRGTAARQCRCCRQPLCSHLGSAIAADSCRQLLP